MGCYRQGDCADPEVFATGAVSVMCRYPAEIVRKVTDPNTGLPGKLKWFPSIYEIREALEIANGAAQRIEEADRRVAEQFAERERMASLTDKQRRQEFIARELPKVHAELAKVADPEKPKPLVDIRHMVDCEAKETLRRFLDRQLADTVEGYKADPVRASDRLLSTVAGTPPRRIEPEVADDDLEF